jgi:integrase
MASILIKLDKRKQNRRGEYPVIIRISGNQTTTSINTGIQILPEAWISDGLLRPVKSTWGASKLLNDKIERTYLEMRKRMTEIEDIGKIKTMSAVEIKKRLLRADKVMEGDRFYPFAEEYISRIKADKTRKIYEYTLKKIRNYEKKDIRFQDINKNFLRKFDEHLIEAGSGTNTRSIHFRNIRAIFNRAIDEEKTDAGLYPFRSFRIKTEQKPVEYLTPEQIRDLYSYDFKAEALSKARDFWMLSFFLCGINPIDLFHMKKQEGRITFERTKMINKTHEKVRLKIQPEAQQIINRYAGTEYLLEFESRYLSYDIFYKFISKKIKEIAKIKRYGKFTLYWARYSWATIADGLDIPEKIISKGLGHIDKTMAGKRYIAFDWTKVDTANRLVIDHILSITN